MLAQLLHCLARGIGPCAAGESAAQLLVGFMGLRPLSLKFLDLSEQITCFASDVVAPFEVRQRLQGARGFRVVTLCERNFREQQIRGCEPYAVGEIFLQAGQMTPRLAE